MPTIFKLNQVEPKKEESLISSSAKRFNIKCVNIFRIVSNVNSISKGQTEKFECDICHKCYSCRNYLKNHKNRHLIHERLKCSLCNKTFSAKGHLKAHILQHHQKEKKHICNICSNKFTRFSSLKTHLQLHTSSVTYKCPFENCGKEYREKANLYIHTKKKHSIKTPLPSTNDSSDNEKKKNKTKQNSGSLFNFYINEDENETLSDSDDHENVDDFLYKLIKSINLSSYNNVQGSTEEFTDFTILI